VIRPWQANPTDEALAPPAKADGINGDDTAAQNYYDARDDFYDGGAEHSYDREVEDRVYHGREPSGHDDYTHHDWPDCFGTCVAGSCKLDQQHPGCCYLQASSGDYDKHYSGYAQQQPYRRGEVKTVAQPSYRDRSKGGLFCWEGQYGTPSDEV